MAPTVNPGVTNIARENIAIVIGNECTWGVAASGKMSNPSARNSHRNRATDVLVCANRSIIQPQKKKPASQLKGGIHSTYPISACDLCRTELRYREDR